MEGGESGIESKALFSSLEQTTAKKAICDFRLQSQTHVTEINFLERQQQENQSRKITRMHSSRMRTARSSSRRGGGVLASSPSTSPWVPCGPGPDPPKLPPWLWAWTRSPSIFPLGVGLDQISLNFPPWLWAWRPPWDQAPHWDQATPWDQAPPPDQAHPHPLWTEFLTHASENITLSQTSFAGGKNTWMRIDVDVDPPPSVSLPGSLTFYEVL